MNDLSDNPKILTKTGKGVSVAWLRKEVEEVKIMMDQLPFCQTKEQYQSALAYCVKRLEGLICLSRGY